MKLDPKPTAAAPYTESSETLAAAASPLDDLLFFLKSSRPGFWLTSIWFYLLPLAQRPVFETTGFWLGLFFVTFPLGILIYGWNDVADGDNDRWNARKGGYLFGAQGTAAQLAKLPWLIAAVHLPLLGWLSLTFGPRLVTWYGLLVGVTALYNWPRVGFKNFPILDLLNQLGYLLVFYLSSALNQVPQLPRATFIFGGLFAMHSHLLGQIMDLEPDRRAGRLTTAGVIGAVPAKLLLVAFLLFETCFVGRVFGDPVVSAFLGGGALWFVVDAGWLFRARPYPTWLEQLFLLGWNAMALGSCWYVWSSGAFSRAKSTMF